MITRKLAISAGHSNTEGRDQGATNNITTEGKATVDLRNRLVAKFKEQKITVNVDKDNSVTKETVSVFTEYFDEHDILIDIHFNSSNNETATGTEVIIPEKYSTFEYSIASDISRTMSNVLGIRNRGVKTESQTARGKLAWMRMNAETILIEVCFLSNLNDMERYIAKRDTLVTELVNIISNYKSLQIL
jgi:N-acetylmuramoyl-L-alanine amidase